MQAVHYQKPRRTVYAMTSFSLWLCSKTVKTLDVVLSSVVELHFVLLPGYDSLKTQWRHTVFYYVTKQAFLCFNCLVFKGLLYQSIPSLTILPPSDPRGFARCHCPGGRVFAQLSLPGGGGGRGFELEKFSTVLKEICRNFSIWFKETGGSLKSKCSCAVSYQFCKNSISTVSLIT